MTTKIYRKSLRKIITEFNVKVGKSKPQVITLRDLNEFQSLINAAEKDANTIVKTRLEQEMYLFYLSLQCLTSISLVLYNETDAQDSVFLEDWLSVDGDPNPNFVLRNIVVQIVNYSLAIGTLIEDGLDYPARAILKTNNELIWQLLILLSDRAVFKNYCQFDTEEQSIKKWQKLFAKGKIVEHIEKLEANLGLPKEYLKDLKLWRKDAQAFYEKSLLHSFTATHAGAFSLDFDNHEPSSAILGTASATSIKTLEHINFQLWYCIVLFFNVLEDMCKYKIPLENEFWYRASVCKECVMVLFLETYHSDS